MRKILDGTERGREDKPLTPVLYSTREGGELYGAIFGKPEFAPIFFQQRKPNAKKPRTMPQKAFGTIRGLRSSLSESYSAVSSEASASSTASESAATSAVSTSVASAASASSATTASFSPPTITFTVVLISR